METDFDVEKVDRALHSHLSVFFDGGTHDLAGIPVATEKLEFYFTTERLRSKAESLIVVFTGCTAIELRAANGSRVVGSATVRHRQTLHKVIRQTYVAIGRASGNPAVSARSANRAWAQLHKFFNVRAGIFEHLGIVSPTLSVMPDQLNTEELIVLSGQLRFQFWNTYDLETL